MTSPRLVVATANQNKLAEIRQILAKHLPNVDTTLVVDQAQYGVGDIVEDGANFAENATIKAQAVAHASGLPALADDSGLIVDVLGQAPGILSARWSGHHGADTENYQLLLRQIADLPDTLRAAHFTCAATLALPTGQSTTEHGHLTGSLTRTARGNNGFGYDPIFVPTGWQKTLAETNAEQKNKVSHRAQAVTKLIPELAKLFH